MTFFCPRPLWFDMTRETLHLPTSFSVPKTKPPNVAEGFSLYLQNGSWPMLSLMSQHASSLIAKCVGLCMQLKSSDLAGESVVAFMYGLFVCYHPVSLSFSHFYECVWVGAGEPVLPPVCVRIRSLGLSVS